METNSAEQDLLTREEKKANQQEDTPKKKRKKKYRTRKFSITLRILVVLVLLVISLLVGLIVGYGFIGDGEPLDALNMDTYRHIIDIVNKEK